MSRWYRAAVQSGLAFAFVAACVSAASAYEAPRKRHHVWTHVLTHRPGEIYVRKSTRSYLDPGPSAVVDSEDLYFNDTKYPHYLLGPGILQRFDEATGMTY